MNKDKKKIKESTIGKIIYGFLLFLPLIFIFSACLTQIFQETGNNENIFLEAITTLKTNTLFSWTTSTPIYNVVDTFMTQLSITDAFFSMLMTYWLMISIAYLVYDLGLMMLLICHRKIHELGDNI